LAQTRLLAVVLVHRRVVTFTALSHFDEAINKVVVLALFVPLCISTGGNSGSQAATLITRAMALGQVTLADWFRVLRHELTMGLVLGLTLGHYRLCPRRLHAGGRARQHGKRQDKFTLKVPKDEDGNFDVKEDAEDEVVAQFFSHGQQVRSPAFSQEVP